MASTCAPAAAELQAVVASGPSQILAWEICGSSQSGLTEECLRNDISCRRLTIENGYDLTKRAVYLQAKLEIEHEKPCKAWLSLPCSIWSARHDLVQRSPEQQQNFDAKRRLQRSTLVRNGINLLCDVLDNGGEIYKERPLGCLGFSLCKTEIDRLYQAAERNGKEICNVEVEGCAYETRDPDSKKFADKGWQILTTDPEFRDKLENRCSKDHAHLVLSGSLKLTAWSAF